MKCWETRGVCSTLKGVIFCLMNYKYLENLYQDLNIYHRQVLLRIFLLKFDKFNSFKCQFHSYDNRKALNRMQMLVFNEYFWPNFDAKRMLSI